ncbi:hypothetical protein PIB30_052560 [Stylosanthes scabra]|uniref:Uncharacterized protein n=1 Tax=Stylosanthes scabra TaxID=79078 RepID=A0ABU6WIA6_9FABA|nr:hypothetical protein [Stylosanthes scabra]
MTPVEVILQDIKGNRLHVVLLRNSLISRWGQVLVEDKIFNMRCGGISRWKGGPRKMLTKTGKELQRLAIVVEDLE